MVVDSAVVIDGCVDMITGCVVVITERVVVIPDCVVVIIGCVVVVDIFMAAVVDSPDVVASNVVVGTVVGPGIVVGTFVGFDVITRVVVGSGVVEIVPDFVDPGNTFFCSSLNHPPNQPTNKEAYQYIVLSYCAVIAISVSLLCFRGFRFRFFINQVCTTRNVSRCAVQITHT